MLKRFILIISNFQILSGFGGTWKPVPLNISSGHITGIYASKVIPLLIVATLKNGLHQSSDNGSSWIQKLSTTDSIFSLTVLNDKVWLVGVKGAVYRTIDGGNNWTRNSVSATVPIGKIVVHPSGRIILGTGSIWDFSTDSEGKGILISDDTAKTFTSSNNGLKEDILVESLLISPDGSVLAGLQGKNSGFNDSTGLFQSQDRGVSWKRVSLNILTPSGYIYENYKLRVTSVQEISLINNRIVVALEGVYVNYSLGFSAKINFDQLSNENSKWKIHWIVDTIPSNGSFYESTLNLFKDSKSRQWASVKGTGDNKIWQGDILKDSAWIADSEGLKPGDGKYIFTEDRSGNIYSARYFGGAQLYVYSDNIAGLSEDLDNKRTGWQVFPNPLKSILNVKSSEVLKGQAELWLSDLSGHLVFQSTSNITDGEIKQSISYRILCGTYLLKITSDNKSEVIKVVFD